MLTLSGIYDGKNITVQEAVPFQEQYDVVITFLKPRNQSAPTVENASATVRTESTARSVPERTFRHPSEVPIEEKRAAVNRLAGCIKGSTITLEEARAERLARK